MQTSHNEGCIVELEQVIDLVNDELLIGQQFEQHKTHGTLTNYYNELLERVAANMVTIAVYREFQDLEPLDDPHEVLSTIGNIADLISTVFNKPYTQVHDDVLRIVETFPATDCRTAAYLKQQNRLN